MAQPVTLQSVKSRSKCARTAHPEIGSFNDCRDATLRVIDQRTEQSPSLHDSSHINQKEMRVIGMSRSGNHAILNWILKQSSGHICHLNCAEGKTNPFLSARELHHGLPYHCNIADFDLVQEQQANFAAKNLLLHSYEDSFLGYVCHPVFEENHDQWVGRSREQFDILILRDPYNLFASRQQAGAELGEVSPATAMRIWKQHAREYLGRTRHLRHTPVLINYNHWVSSRSYRRALATRLGLTFTDAGIDAVTRTAGGSSFDGTHFDGAATQMRVLERWKFYQNDPAFRQLLRPDVAELAQQIFGALPGIDTLK